GRTRQAAEQAANPADVRGHYVLEGVVNAADEKRREAEDQLFLASDARANQRLWTDAVGDGSTGGYQAAIRRAERVTAMFGLRDEVWSDLPLISEWHFARAGAARRAGGMPSLATLYERSIELDDALERLLRSRDEEGTIAA